MQQRLTDAHWSLGMVLVWITYRSEEAVNLKGKWTPTSAAIRDLLSALRSGKLIAHGMAKGERMPHPIETAVWSTFEIVIKPKMFVGHVFLPTWRTPIVITQRMGHPQTRLLSVTVPAVQVRKLWPLAKQTAAATTRCREYLRTEMKKHPNQAPKSKSAMLKCCQARFRGLSERGFNRAWADAIRQAGAVGWSKAGRPRKSSH